jgi:Flp pilus assembly protein TadD
VVFVITLISLSGGSGSIGRPTATPAQLSALPTTTSAEITPQSALSAAPDARELEAQGADLIRQGRWEEAIPLFQRAAAADPSWHQPLSDLAFCLYELGWSEEAIAHWRAALALNPSSQDANAGLGMALYQAGHQDEGLAAYRRAIELGGAYRDENWMRGERLWSDKAIGDSRALREQLEP